MEHFEVDGRLYEVIVVSEALGDDYAVECCDLSPGGAGHIGVLSVMPDCSGSLTLFTDVSIAVLRKWISVAEQEAGLHPP